MYGITLMMLFLSFVLVSASSDGPEEKISAKVIIVDNIEKFKAENPTVVLTQLEKNQSGRAQIAYTLGNRVNGDVLVAQESDSVSWATPHDVQIILQYPAGGGLGAVVTYVVVIVNQSNESGQAYVVDGGIGYRHITFIVEAYGTTYFNYNARIFGR